MTWRSTSRVVGIDDGPFRHAARARVLVVGVLMQGGGRVDAVLSTRIVRDGSGATRAVARMLGTGRHAGQAQAVLLDGIALGGFNVVDLPALSQRLGAPVLAVMSKLPDLDAVRSAMRRTSGFERRWQVLQRAGPIHEGPSGQWFQVAGTTPGDARRLLSIAAPRGGCPEALRLAHLIGAGVVLGASRGGA